MFHRSIQAVGGETKCIEKIAFPRAVLPNEEVQASQLKRASGNAHKILQHNFTKKDGWISHIFNSSGSRYD
jgi:hypothetical protein